MTVPVRSSVRLDVQSGKTTVDFESFSACARITCSDNSYPKGSSMFDRKAIRPYHHPAGGWGALIRWFRHAPTIP